MKKIKGITNFILEDLIINWNDNLSQKKKNWSDNQYELCHLNNIVNSYLINISSSLVTYQFIRFTIIKFVSIISNIILLLYGKIFHNPDEVDRRTILPNYYWPLYNTKDKRIDLVFSKV